MARRTKIEAAATRGALLDAAERVFRERGVARTSLAEVAASAGVTRGAVYWHFRDKAELFEALCERVQLPMEAMLASAGEIRQKDPLGALRAPRGQRSRAACDQRAGPGGVRRHLSQVRVRGANSQRSADRRYATDTGCLANVERLLKQAVTRRAASARCRHRARGALPRTHSWSA
mgnify:CR=1 FL=1